MKLIKIVAGSADVGVYIASSTSSICVVGCRSAICLKTLCYDVLCASYVCEQRLSRLSDNYFKISSALLAVACLSVKNGYYILLICV